LERRVRRVRAASPSPPVGLEAEGRGDINRDGVCRARVRLTNPTEVLAFFVRLRAVKPGGGGRILPVFYDDNYLTILPHESVTVGLEFRADLPSGLPVITADAWNTAPRGVVRVRWTHARDANR